MDEGVSPNVGDGLATGISIVTTGVQAARYTAMISIKKVVLFNKGGLPVEVARFR